MNPFFHASIGLAIHTTIYAVSKDEFTTFVVGVPLSIFSHWVADFLFEAKLSSEDMLTYEGFGLCIFYGGILFTDMSIFWLFFFLSSWCSGNLLDFIDKKMYLATIYPDKFKVTNWFHNHKKGIKFTKRQTKNSAIVGGVITVICIYVINSL